MEIKPEMIEDVLWYTQMMGPPYQIGIVLLNTGFGYKAYIGTANGSDEEYDSRSIATFGAKFHEGPRLWPSIKWWADIPETRPVANPEREP